MSDNVEVMHYKASPTVSKFIRERSFVSVIIGPIGSGKTLGSIMRWFDMIHRQEPSIDGIRHTRTAVIRNTYTELKDTTIKSFTEWFGDDLKMNWGNLTAVYEHDDVRGEILFRSLDKVGDMKKLLSLELTYAYLNEARELPQEALYNVTSRLGRYPSPTMGVKATYPSAWADTNAFDQDNYLYELLINDLPSTFTLYIQPPGILDDGSINPDAENLKNLPDEYYGEFLAGKPEDWIDVMIRVKFIPLQVGKPVYREYNDGNHCIDQKQIHKPDPSKAIVCGVENGRTSAVVFGQVDNFMRLLIFDEITSDDMGSIEFGRIVKAYIQANYADYKFKMYADPAANSRTQLDDNTQVKAWVKMGLPLELAPTNKPEDCVEAVKYKLLTRAQDWPMFMISSKCARLRKALNGAYQYKRINVSGERYGEKPDKGPYSHICFTAGTKILTPSGPKNLEELNIGDYVTTPLGNKKIVTLFTREAEVIGLNGTYCTDDHPFYTLKGYVKASTLEYLVQNNRSILWKIHWLLKVQDVSTKYIYLMVKDIIKEVIITQMKITKDYTSKFGSLIKDQYQMAMTYTIGILTNLTMKLKIYNVCQNENTTNCTWHNQDVKKFHLKVLTKQEQVLENGIKRILAREDLQHLRHKKPHKKCGINTQQLYVPGAVKNLKYTAQLKQEQTKHFAQDTAPTRLELQVEWMMKLGLVKFVELILNVTNILKRKRVHENARLHYASKQKVFNIEVADAHCYYADGYLVSNCNAAEYLVAGIGGVREITQRRSKHFQNYQDDFNRGKF